MNQSGVVSQPFGDISATAALQQCTYHCTYRLPVPWRLQIYLLFSQEDCPMWAQCNYLFSYPFTLPLSHFLLYLLVFFTFPFSLANSLNLFFLVFPPLSILPE